MSINQNRSLISVGYFPSFVAGFGGIGSSLQKRRQFNWSTYAEEEQIEGSRLWWGRRAKKKPSLYLEETKIFGFVGN